MNKMKPSLIFRKAFLVFIASLIFLGCVNVPLLPYLGSTATPSITYSPIILENSLGLTLLWEKPGVILEFSAEQEAIVFAQDKIVLFERADHGSGSVYSKLLCFDVNTGNFLWETKVSDVIIDVAYDQDNLYVLTLDNVLRSYKILDGFLVWEAPQIKYTKLMALERGQNTLYIIGRVASWDEKDSVIQIYTADPMTGNVDSHVKEIKNEMLGRLWFVTTENYYWAREDEIFMTDLTISNSKWRFLLPVATGQLPSLYEMNHEILLITKYMMDSLYAVDVNSGELLWQYDHQLMSSPDIGSERVYALLPGYKLLGLDSFSGKDLGYVQLSTLPDTNFEPWGNFVVASGGHIAVYLDQYQELLVFGEE
jgi:outer membrane protein assembly factor BamB